MSIATTLHPSQPIAEPSYAYNEDAMLAEIAIFKHEQREDIAARMRLIEAGAPTRNWDHVPVIVARHPLSDLNVLPHWARWCCFAVCAEYRIKFEDITRVSNKRVDVLPRRVAMYLMVRVAGGGLHQTGVCLGGLHHSTVYAGVTEIERRRLVDPKLNARVERTEIEARRHLELAYSTGSQQPTTLKTNASLTSSRKDSHAQVHI
jgi:hypothetical protein